MSEEFFDFLLHLFNKILIAIIYGFIMAVFTFAGFKFGLESMVNDPDFIKKSFCQEDFYRYD